MSEHTPRPWTVGPQPTNTTHIVVSHPTGGNPTHEAIAALPPHNPATPANAHLIAAAPDLLAACEAALVDAKALQKVAFVDYPHLEAIIWNLEHAIDRARGA